MCLAGLILINDTDDNTRLNMEKIADDTKKMEILMVEESRNPSSHDFGLNAGDEKKHSWSTISIDAISSLDTKHNLETSSINSNRNSPTKIKSHFKRRFAENPYTCEQADYNNIIPTVRSDTIDTIPTEERLANYPQTANALQSKEEDETWGIAEEEKDCINKNVQENIKNIESSTRKKKRHKIILDRTKYSTYSNNEQHFNADNKWWKVLSSGTALPAEKNKIIRKSTRKPFIITCENIRDYQGSSKNDSEIQKQTDQRTQTISHHRNSYNEAGKAMCTEKCIPKFEQDSELSKNIVMNKFNSDFKKEIIPLSNESFIKDLANAQEKYLKRENNLIDSEGAIPCVFYSKINEETIVRKRKSSIIHSESEKKKIIETITRLSAAKLNWFSRLCFFFFQQELPQTSKKIVAKGGLTFKEYHQTYKQPTKGTSFSCSKNQPHQCIAKQLPRKSNSRETILKFVSAFRDLSTEFKKFLEQNPRQVNIIMILRNRCFAELIIIIIYCGFGAFIFRFTEGAFETFYKCGVKRVKRDFLDSLWIYSHNLREEDWKSMARRKLMEFEEQLHVAHDAGVHTYSGKKSWTFSNAVVYCFTVITTIGYGHIAPTTTTGRAVTIVYAIFGIPMFLIILADFGKLFTRGIKFLWAFIRRLYYTGSCREARRTVNVQEVRKGVQLVYDFATFRRPSQMNLDEVEEMKKHGSQTQNVLTVDGNIVSHPESISVPNTPDTPDMSTFAIDDEFNLPISLAISILLGYIFIGATLYHLWEREWSFFESFYFVFISMSTIGFGDYVPTHPMYMMCSIVYLVFGLALTSMCINVVQVMLSDQFRHASQKIGATIGFEVVEEGLSIQHAELQPIEVTDVHTAINDCISNEGIINKK